MAGEQLNSLEAIYQQTLQALEISLSSVSSSELRSAAGTFLEQLKASEDCMRVMLHILTADGEAHSSTIRQLALSVANDWLKTWWNKISAEDQGVIRGTFLTLLQSDSVGLSPSRSLRTSLSVALANIAERHYPQLWPKFLEDMVAVWQSSPLERQEVVILCLEAVIVDCIDSDYSSALPSQRRQEILAGFRVQIEMLLHTAYASLVDNGTKYQQYSSESPEGKAVVSIANATLKMLRPFVNFIKAVEACKDPHDFSSLCLAMLSLPGLQEKAAALLHIITQDKLPREHFAKMLQSIPANPVTVFPSDFSDCVAFRRTYAEAVFALFSENISQAVDPAFLALEGAPQTLGQYVTLMATLMENASSRLAADVLKDWTRILKEPAIATLPWMSEVCLMLLRVYATKAVRGVWVEEHSRPLSDMDAAEFDEFEDYTEFHGKFISQLRLLLTLVSTKFPAVSASFMYSKVTEAIAQYGHITPKEGVSCSKDSDAAREWDVVNINISVILKSIENVADPSVAPALSSTVDALLAWTPAAADKQLVTARIKAIQFSSSILRVSPAHLFGAFSSLLDLLSVSTQAGLALSHLAERCSREVVSSNLVAELVPRLLTLLAQDTAGAHEKAHAREALVAISESMPEPQRRAELLVAALGDMVESWKACAAVMASPQDLLQRSHNGGLGGGLADIITLLNSILTASKKVALPRIPDEVWTHGVSFTTAQLAQIFAFTPVWQEVLPGIVRATESLHGLFSVETRQQLSQQAEVAPIYLPSSKEIHLAAGVAAESPSGNGASAHAPSMAENVRRELLELRSSLYQLLGQAASHKVLYTSAELQPCLSTVAAALPMMENTHLSMLILRFVEPFVLNAPPAAYGETAAFLSVFFRELMARLSVAWDRSDEAGGGAAAAAAEDGDGAVARFIYRHCSLPTGQAHQGISAETLEIAKDKMIGEMTKAFAETMASIGMTRNFLASSVPTDVPASIMTLGGEAPKERKDRRSPKSASPRSASFDDAGGQGAGLEESHRELQKQARRAAMSSLIMGPRSGLTKPFVEAVLALLCIPDVDACHWGLELAMGLAKQSLADQRLLVAVGKEAFSAALMVLLRGEKFSAGMEWTLIEFCQEVYCGLLLGVPMRDNTQTFPAGFCDYPRQVLLQVPGCSVAQVQHLEKQLAASATKKKKRRECFRDLVSDIKIAQGNDTTVHSASAITNLRERFIVSSKLKSKRPNGGDTTLLASTQEANLANLFD